MCDTVVVTAEATARGRLILAKNSDREPGEAQALELHPAADGLSGATHCTYIDVPAASQTHAALLSRPHWIWGAEMGVNERGLAIGNEAVFTRAPREPLALLGMDLLRLALERAASAEQGVELMTALLESYGQGGPAGYRDRRFVYDNSFILADPDDAWVVETAGRAWVAKRVRGVRAISNGLTLRDDWDRASSGLAARARDWKLDPGKGRVDFARTFGNPLMTRAAAAVARRACNESYLSRRTGSVGVRDAMAALRQHGRHPGRGVFASVCAHAAWWPTRRSAQTTSSLIAELGTTERVSWVTATAAPCTSLFKPIWLDAGLPNLGPTPRDHVDQRALWWRHERLHRRALADLPGFLAEFSPVRDAIEARLVERASELERAPAAARFALSEHALAQGDALDARFIDSLPERAPRGALDRLFWHVIDRQSA